MCQPTTTSEEIIEFLTKQRKLDKEEKNFIRKKVYNAIVAAGEWQSNGCDCGQVWCPIIRRDGLGK